MSRSGLLPISDDTEIYARPDGWHYHLSAKCPMLTGGDFERLHYKLISKDDIKTRGLSPCACAYKSRRTGENE